MTHFIFDCDDVLLDWFNPFCAFLRGKGFHVPESPPCQFSLADWLTVPAQTMVGLITEFNASPAFGNLKAMVGARDVVWSLRDAGHTISVLTACGDTAAVRLARASNLAAAFCYTDLPVLYHYPFRGYDFVPLGESKFNKLFSYSHDIRLGCDLVFIEDSFAHAQSGVVCGIKTYCLRRSHNRRDEEANPDSAVIWIDDLREVAA